MKSVLQKKRDCRNELERILLLKVIPAKKISVGQFYRLPYIACTLFFTQQYFIVSC